MNRISFSVIRRTLLLMAVAVLHISSQSRLYAWAKAGWLNFTRVRDFWNAENCWRRIPTAQSWANEVCWRIKPRIKSNFEMQKDSEKSKETMWLSTTFSWMRSSWAMSAASTNYAIRSSGCDTAFLSKGFRSRNSIATANRLWKALFGESKNALGAGISSFFASQQPTNSLAALCG